MKPLVDDLIGKPWQLGARGPDAYDCWGLVREVMQRMQPGLALPDWASDTMTRERQRAVMAGAAVIHGEPVDEFVHGTLLFSQRAAHIAIVVDRWALTARRHAGVVAMRTNDYAAHFSDLKAYRWRA